MHRLVIISLLFTTQLFAAPKRPQGGTFHLRLPAEPTTLNPYTASDGYSSQIHGYILEGLLTQNPDTYEWEPNLAEKWEISKDKKTFTFTLRKGLKFSDGTPLTAPDIKFSFDSIKDDNFKSPIKKTYLEGISAAEVVDPQTIKFIAKENLWQNFDYIAGGILEILPKHKYSNPKKRMNKVIFGSGPYVLDKYEKGKRIILKKNPNWWGWQDANKKGLYNFDAISFRIVDSENVALEMLKKEKLDFKSLQPEDYVMKTNTPEWGKSVFKVKTKNIAPKGYNWIGWNLENEKLKDKRVRRALAHLMNRKLMIDKFRHGMGVLMTGPVHPQSDYAAKVKPIEFSIKKAVKLLKEAGWSDSDKNGILDKKIKGQKVDLTITILLPTPFWEKYVTVYKEDAKKAGVDIQIKNMEWNAFIKLLNEKKFDAIIMAWGAGGIHWDPKQIWHSDSARPGGSNRISYKNKQVDKWIDEARKTWDKNKRIKILHKVFKQIAEDAPYLFMFSSEDVLYAHTKNVKKPKDTFNYTVGINYWWSAKQ